LASKLLADCPGDTSWPLLDKVTDPVVRDRYTVGRALRQLAIGFGAATVTYALALAFGTTVV